jgi:hypothetical protein
MEFERISNRGSIFIGRFWVSLQEALGMKQNFSTSYHLDTDGKIKRMNETFEDMLRKYVMDQRKHWKEFLPLVEFAYNNSYECSINMEPFKCFMVDHVGHLLVGIG